MTQPDEYQTKCARAGIDITDMRPFPYSDSTAIIVFFEFMWAPERGNTAKRRKSRLYHIIYPSKGVIMLPTEHDIYKSTYELAQEIRQAIER